MGSKPGFLRRVLGGFWDGLTWLRSILANLILLLVLVMLFIGMTGKAPDPLPEKGALLLNPAGVVVDQKSYTAPLDSLLGGGADFGGEVLLRDMIDAVERAAQDDNITALVLQLEGLMGLGVSKSQELAPAIATFKASGKPIIAIGDYYTQDQYLLASMADEVMLHPAGGVILEGYGSYRQYYRQALDKLSVSMHVFRAGKHKSYAEPWMRDDMSEDEKRISARWLNSLWSQYAQSVEQARSLEQGSLTDYVNQQDILLQAQQGDMAKMAEAGGLVDALMTRAALNDYLVDVVGASDDAGDYQAVDFQRYLQRTHSVDVNFDQDTIAVVTARGEILPGDQPPGVIGGDTLAHEIRAAVDDDNVKALVLRVDSGGGSVFASEVIRQAMLEVKQKGLPVVVSMGSVAASGGYYIAADADEIWATPGTITGSIGVFAAFPTVEKLLERLGISTDGVGTTDLAGSMRTDRPLNPKVAAIAQSSVDYIYRDFIGLVANGRNMSVEAVDAVAQGRVWSAVDAQERGLVDHLGVLNDAVASAAKLAGLTDYHVNYVQPELSAKDQFVKNVIDELGLANIAGDIVPSLMIPVREAIRQAGSLRDPGHLYMRCHGCQAF